MIACIKATVSAAIERAKRELDAGDPTQAVDALSVALLYRSDIPQDACKLIEQAQSEADIGNPATAETLLGLIQL